MSSKEISRRDQQCISSCIMEHWNEHSKIPPGQREASYEKCLTNCRVCS